MDLLGRGQRHEPVSFSLLAIFLSLFAGGHLPRPEKLRLIVACQYARFIFLPFKPFVHTVQSDIAIACGNGILHLPPRHQAK